MKKIGLIPFTILIFILIAGCREGQKLGNSLFGNDDKPNKNSDSGIFAALHGTWSAPCTAVDKVDGLKAQPFLSFVETGYAVIGIDMFSASSDCSDEPFYELGATAELLAGRYNDSNPNLIALEFSIKVSDAVLYVRDQMSKVLKLPDLHIPKRKGESDPAIDERFKHNNDDLIFETVAVSEDFIAPEGIMALSGEVTLHDFISSICPAAGEKLSGTPEEALISLTEADCPIEEWQQMRQLIDRELTLLAYLVSNTEDSSKEISYRLLVDGVDFIATPWTMKIEKPDADRKIDLAEEDNVRKSFCEAAGLPLTDAQCINLDITKTSFTAHQRPDFVQP